MKSSCKRARFTGVLALSGGLLMVAFPVVAPGQMQRGSRQSSQQQSPSENESGNYEPSTPATSSTSQSPFLSSVPEGKATGTVLPLSFKDALDRALRNNLGLLLASDSSLAAR